ncbi:MAG: hypothetical protein AAF901_08940, partial [Bacteroidota bacterium]
VYGSSRLGTYFVNTSKPAYELSDHLGNVRAVIERSSTVIRTADYYPFGLVMHQSGEKARYGYQGQYAEDETESTGWNSFELRML